MFGPYWFLKKIEPSLGKLEEAYQEHYFAPDRTQSIFGLIVYDVLLLYFVRADYVFWGDGLVFRLLLVVRLVFIFASVAAVIFALKTYSRTNFERISIVLIFGSAILNHVINLSRPRDYMDYVALNIVALFVLYFVFPLHIKWRFSAAVLATIFELYNLDSKTISLSTWTSLVTAYLVTNLIGLMISGWFYTLRRYNFSLFHREREANKELEYLVMQDSLTGAKNRRYFITQGTAEVERALRYDRPMTVVIIDMDNFKAINDLHGHLAGDRVLRIFVDTIKSNVRQPDIFARIGGDEFGLIMPETRENEARDIVGRLYDIVRGVHIAVSEKQIQLSFTAGLAESAKNDSILDLLGKADKNLYLEKAKKDGQDPVPYLLS